MFLKSRKTAEACRFEDVLGLTEALVEASFLRVTGKPNLRCSTVSIASNRLHCTRKNITNPENMNLQAICQALQWWHHKSYPTYTQTGPSNWLGLLTQSFCLERENFVFQRIWPFQNKIGELTIWWLLVISDERSFKVLISPSVFHPTNKTWLPDLADVSSLKKILNLKIKPLPRRPKNTHSCPYSLSRFGRSAVPLPTLTRLQRKWPLPGGELALRQSCFSFGTR